MTISEIFPNSHYFFLCLPLIFSTIIRCVSAATCELSFEQNNNIYNFSLSKSIPNFPHGVLSEDGFYKLAVNGTVLWFQLCDAMIFNHDPPTCVDCTDCGGISRCGMGCSALVANSVGGYPVCTTLGYSSTTYYELIDKKDPLKGITAKMSNRGSKLNCSLAVSVICDTNGIQAPQTLELVGTCDYIDYLLTGYTITSPLRLRSNYILSWARDGLVWFLDYHNPMPLWSVLAWWCNLSVLLFGHSWDRHNSKLGALGQLAT